MIKLSMDLFAANIQYGMLCNNNNNNDDDECNNRIHWYCISVFNAVLSEGLKLTGIQ